MQKDVNGTFLRQQLHLSFYDNNYPCLFTTTVILVIFTTIITLVVLRQQLLWDIKRTLVLEMHVRVSASLIIIITIRLYISINELQRDVQPCQSTKDHNCTCFTTTITIIIFTITIKVVVFTIITLVVLTSTINPPDFHMCICKLYTSI